jgi:hypothetical protein
MLLDTEPILPRREDTTNGTLPELDISLEDIDTEDMPVTEEECINTISRGIVIISTTGRKDTE